MNKNTMRQRLPLDMKVFITSSLLIGGVFLLPDEPTNEIVVTIYLVFIFVSIAISAFCMTWVRDSKYNFFRMANTLYGQIVTIALYVLICTGISYILAVTDLFLFLF